MQSSVAKDGDAPTCPATRYGAQGANLWLELFVERGLFRKPEVDPRNRFEGMLFPEHTQTQKDPGICAGVFSSRQYFEISG
jgi:hypothetical protein